MNVLFFSRLFYPHIGGVEKHVLEVSRLLIKKGHKIIVITQKHEEGLKDKEIIEDVKVCRIKIGKNEWFKKFEIWIWFFRNLSLIRQADIIHCHDVFFWYLPFRFLFPFKKIFTTFHGYEDYPLKSKDIIMRKISEKLSFGAICVGDFIKKWYGTRPDFVSYGAVSISEIKNQKSKIKNENSALFVGRLDGQTGILIYDKAVEILKKKIPNFYFLVIGDGDLKDKISKEIKILKPLSNASEYFQKYNFAFVSRYLSILEAMAARRLVFAVYDNPLKEDYLRMAPFSKYIIISNSSSELVSEIYFYLDNPKAKQEMIDKAYAWVKKQPWEKLVNIYLKLWS